MEYQNPIVKGMYPDPSVCRAGDKYYLVCSTFQYFPGVPLFESEDMVNWKQIGHCLTRPSQVMLEGVRSSGGIFAPTIRYHEGRFYMVTTNDSTRENFYVYTDDIYGEWSDPIKVEQDGIDPSLYFEGDRTYFISNGADDDNKGCIQMCEIDVKTGKKLSGRKILWHGTGGRYLEAPHLYRFGDWYYLLEAEGGTEYGHMVNYARSKDKWGPYEPYPNNPVLTNRNLGGYSLQGAGHGDIIEDRNGNWWFIHLAFRQIGMWKTFHHLGRETCLEPLYWNEDGWFTIGEEKTARLEHTLDINGEYQEQQPLKEKTFETTNWDKEWCYLRIPRFENYKKGKDSLALRGSKVTLDEADTPTFLGIRQQEFHMNLDCNVRPGQQEAGITIYADEKAHYDFGVRGTEKGTSVFVRYTIGEMKQVINEFDVTEQEICLHIKADPDQYAFYVGENDGICLGKLETRFLSSEVAGGFTGVFIGLYAENDSDKEQWAEFSNFKITY